MALNAQTPRQRPMGEQQGFPGVIPSLIRRSLFCSRRDRGWLDRNKVQSLLRDGLVGVIVEYADTD